MDQTELRNKTKRPADEVPATQANEYPVVGAPIVRDGSKKKKRKRGSSRQARRIEDIERRTSKALRRITRAVNRGMGRYIDERDKSDRKRQDGAIVDFYVNASRGIADAVGDSSPALVDISKAFNRKRHRRQMRRFLRRLPRIPFIV